MSLSSDAPAVGGDRAGQRLLRGLFRGYRAAVSPLFGPSCRYIPTCSHYTEQAMQERGFVRGLALGFWRILRCHPFARGGFDPVSPAATLPSSSNLASCTRTRAEGGKALMVRQSIDGSRFDRCAMKRGG